MLLATLRIWSMPLVYDDASWLDQAGAGWSIPSAPFHLGLLLSGGLPWGPRAVLLALHLLNGALLWWIARRWLSVIASGLVVVLGALHPLPLQAVFYLTGGREVWLATMALLAFAAGLRGGIPGWLVAIPSLAVAILIKPSALPLLAVLPLAWLVAAQLADLAMVGLALLVAGGILVTPQSDLTRDAIASWALSLWRYTGLAIWPVGFSIVHDWWTVPQTVGVIAIVAMVLVGLFASIVSRPAWLAWLWMVLLTVPRAVVRNAPPLTEAQMYLPACALWMLAGWSADRWFVKECHG